jgi:hypothetical protein
MRRVALGEGWRALARHARGRGDDGGRARWG